MRARSHKYPNSDDDYVDTTYYHKNEAYLDVGYQLLKIFNIKQYPELSVIKKLFIDHNSLTELPNPKYLPNLTELTCSANHLLGIPFYPKLIFLNIAHNNIKDCSQYHNSQIKYFDCSYNRNFNLMFKLPYCEQLYINNNDVESINLALVPNLKILDAENNNLIKIVGGLGLVEINIKNNCITELPYWPKLVRLNADHNNISKLETYSELRGIFICYNKLVSINDQPKLRKLIATNNYIKKYGTMPNLMLVDLSHNSLSDFKVPDKIEYLSLQFNPIAKLDLGPNALKNIKELQLGFITYKYIYDKYYKDFDYVSVQPNPIKLEEQLKRLSKVFDDNMIDYIYQKFYKTKFSDRADALLKVSLKLYWRYFSKNGAKTMEELVQTREFKYLLHSITTLYYKTIVMTMYFNGYLFGNGNGSHKP